MAPSRKTRIIGGTAVAVVAIGAGTALAQSGQTSVAVKLDDVVPIKAAVDQYTEYRRDGSARHPSQVDFRGKREHLHVHAKRVGGCLLLYCILSHGIQYIPREYRCQ